MATTNSDSQDTDDDSTLSTVFRVISGDDNSDGGFTTEQLRSLQRKTQTEARIIGRGGSQ